MTDDRRLIEDYLPIEAISEEASREKSVRKGHISTLHLWWARRPLVACRAAVYGALVPASQFVPNGGTDAQKKSLGRANAAKFVKSLCQYPGATSTIREAQEHILKAHADRLTKELADGKASGSRPGWVQEFKFVGERVTVDDIQAGRAPRPRVLDMFAGGGAIPLEALRLGCEAYALDLNPVAHIIQLCTLVYPQKFGKPDPNVRGMTGPKNAKGETTWGGLAEEVRYWGNWVLEKVRAEIGDLYPPIPDPEAKPTRAGASPFEEPQGVMGFAEDGQQRLRPKPGYMTPVAYLWTRTVKCKNPTCGATVPLVKQTWLCKKEGRFVALKVVAPKDEKRVRFEVIETTTAAGLGFDPEAFSKGGNATCPFCGTVADSNYVKEEGCAGRMLRQPMAVACTRTGKEGKTYLPADVFPPAVPEDERVQQRVSALCARSGLTVPDEEIVDDAKNSFWVRLYGLTNYGKLFTPRQLLSLLSFAAAIRNAMTEMEQQGIIGEARKAVATMLACVLDKQADRNSSICVLFADGGRGIKNTFNRQALPMAWDFAEANPLCEDIACWKGSLKEVVGNAAMLSLDLVASITRSSATATPFTTDFFDAVITDPPYYDNVSYADLSDFFYVWLKRSVGNLYPEHFAAGGTPKKSEAVADATRHGSDKTKARQAYERMMSEAFKEAHRVLKPGGEIVVVYAHKTTLGWATLVDSLRTSGFVVVEAWPLDTETTGRLLAHASAALASSIFLVARKRQETNAGNYETQVRPELEEIVSERVETLWDAGISGADLVIASVGAGLRAFTRFARVEYANGEEVPAERFLTEVETVVLETILARLSKEVGGKEGQVSLAGLDAASRFYVLWRYTYGAAELEAGEAIIFSNGTHVELDGPHGLATGADNLVEKKKGKYRLRDFSERGEDEDLGMPTDDGQSAPLVDALHRTLWLLEKRPTQLAEFLRESQVNREQLRLVAQALAGPALKGGELGDVSPTTELAALGKLMANWQSVVEGALISDVEQSDRRKGQERLL
ncbi:MAG: DUF1156 domain-containing protein [Verrucomicrobiia bacterium]